MRGGSSCGLSLRRDGWRRSVKSFLDVAVFCLFLLFFSPANSVVSVVSRWFPFCQNSVEFSTSVFRKIIIPVYL